MTENATAASDSGRIKLPANVVQLLFAALVSLALGGGVGTRMSASALEVKLDAQGAKIDAQGAKLDELRETFLELRADRTARAAELADLKAQLAEVRAQVRALELGAAAQKGK